MSPLVWVLAASVMVWGGLFAYLAALEGRLRRLEQQAEEEAAGHPGEAGNVLRGEGAARNGE